jgi:hypothetical protein
MERKYPNYISALSITKTMKSLEFGVPFIFPTSVLKASTARATAFRLSKKGFEFAITESGLINEIQITRMK